MKARTSRPYRSGSRAIRLLSGVPVGMAPLWCHGAKYTNANQHLRHNESQLHRPSPSFGTFLCRWRLARVRTRNSTTEVEANHFPGLLFCSLQFCSDSHHAHTIPSPSTAPVLLHRTGPPPSRTLLPIECLYLHTPGGSRYAWLEQPTNQSAVNSDGGPPYWSGTAIAFVIQLISKGI